MRRAAIAALAACGGAAPPPALPSNQHGAAVRADRTCKRSHEALRRLFITSAGDQLDGVKDQLALDAEPTDTPPAQPGYDDPSAIDPQHLIHVDRPESFEDVLYVDLQVGFDGLYATGVAGIFVGCRYAAISHTAATPIDDEVLRPDALVALGWLTADRAAKQRIARDFVVAVLLNIAYPVSDGKDDFGATFVGDDGKPVHTPAFAPPTATVAADGSAVVVAWLPIPGNMGTQPDDPNGYRLARYAIRPTGEIAVSLGEPFYGDRPSRKKKQP